MNINTNELKTALANLKFGESVSFKIDVVNQKIIKLDKSEIKPAKGFKFKKSKNSKKYDDSKT
jgi:hypothetical protein